MMEPWRNKASLLLRNIGRVKVLNVLYAYAGSYSENTQFSPSWDDAFLNNEFNLCKMQNLGSNSRCKIGKLGSINMQSEAKVKSVSPKYHQVETYHKKSPRKYFRTCT